MKFRTWVICLVLLATFSCSNKKNFPVMIVTEIKKDGIYFVYVCEEAKIDVYDFNSDKAKVGDTLFFFSTLIKKN